MHAVMHLHTYVQLDRTALYMACDGGHEEAAAELMEATKLAGALDVQVGLEANSGARERGGGRAEGKGWEGPGEEGG